MLVLQDMKKDGDKPCFPSSNLAEQEMLQQPLVLLAVVEPRTQRIHSSNLAVGENQSVIGIKDEWGQTLLFFFYEKNKSKTSASRPVLTLLVIAENQLVELSKKKGIN